MTTQDTENQAGGAETVEETVTGGETTEGNATEDTSANASEEESSTGATVDSTTDKTEAA